MQSKSNEEIVPFLFVWEQRTHAYTQLICSDLDIDSITNITKINDIACVLVNNSIRMKKEPTEIYEKDNKNQCIEIERKMEMSPTNWETKKSF